MQFFNWKKIQADTLPKMAHEGMLNIVRREMQIKTTMRMAKNQNKQNADQMPNAGVQSGTATVENLAVSNS